MISKKEAREIAEKYLKQKQIPATSLDKTEEIIYHPAEKITYGDRKDNVIDIYSVCYGKIWGIEERSMFINIDAHSGEVLFTITPHGYIDK